ncbi:PQQ-dependent enzyme [Flammeovirgaceae bacterium 311]|nr:PQQ-dependent enzyme [Flammeovirgaceae bacterium 311]
MNSTFRYLSLASLIFASSCYPQAEPAKEAGTDWPVYLGGNSGAQYSPLDQINRDNIDKLQVAWEFHSEDSAPLHERSQIQCNPLVIDGILYGTSPTLKVFALNAATGEKKWIFNPSNNVDFGLNANRGISYWRDGEDERILFTAGAELICLNARTGEPVAGFGQHGRASLKEGLGTRAQELFVVSTSPGIVFEDKLIIGSRVSEGADAAPGFIRAFNVRTGALEWTFRTIPGPGEFGYETWPKDAHLYIGGANSWSGMSLDTKRRIVFAATGSASFDFWGGNRKGENLFANSVLALDAETGKRVWHYQTVHHDLWDRDLPAPPTLVQVKHNGEMVDAVAQTTKSGFIFLLDRDTGKPLFPVEERAVPASDLQGEEAWPTQPFPLKPAPFTRQSFSREDITDISAESHEYVSEILAKVRTGRPFIPPSEQGTIIFPGFDGGAEWGGAAFDPQEGLLYVNANEMPWIHTMVPTSKNQGKAVNLGETIYLSTCAMCHGPELLGDPTGTYPALKDINRKYKKDEVLQIVNNGRGFMPAFKHIDQEKKEALVNYIMGLGNDPLDAHEIGMEANEAALPYTHTGYNRFLDKDGYPAIKPPWGTLTAIDLNEGAIKWQVPLGEFEELTKKGISKTGTENYGGPVVTAGGLIFIGASKDEYFRAFDKNTGEELWKYKLPAGGYATPSVYQVNGKQYVTIACGGGKMKTKSDDRYITFTLKN